MQSISTVYIDGHRWKDQILGVYNDRLLKPYLLSSLRILFNEAKLRIFHATSSSPQYGRKIFRNNVSPRDDIGLTGTVTK